MFMIKKRRRKQIPTDLEILEAIYSRHYEEFASFIKGNSERIAKNYVPVDIEAIASDYDVDADIIFSRLYYHFEKKYGYKKDDGRTVAFFSTKIGKDKHCVNFPYMTAILAGLQDDQRRFGMATTLSIISLVVAAISLVLSIIR